MLLIEFYSYFYLDCCQGKCECDYNRKPHESEEKKTSDTTAEEMDQDNQSTASSNPEKVMN